MSVDVLPGTSFKTSAPKLVFRAPFAAPYASYEVAPDGKRFIAQLSDERQQHRLLTVVSDWRAALRK
jgi:hypothetical protein